MDAQGSSEDSFLSALSQPLFIQTPLQVILQTLFATVRSQATALADLQAKVDANEASSTSSRSLLTHRLSQLEEYTVGLKRDAEGQQQLQNEDLGKRLAGVEAACAKNEQALTNVKEELEEVEPRVSHVERKLYAADNLAGRAMAVDEMAGVLGVTIPQVMPINAEELPPRLKSLKQPQPEARQPPAPRPQTPPPPAPPLNMAPEAADDLSTTKRRSTTGDMATTTGVLGRLQQDLRISEARELDMKRKLEDMQAVLLAVQRALDANDAKVEQRFGLLEAEARTARRRGNTPNDGTSSPRSTARRDESAPTFADFSALQDQFRATNSDVSQFAARVAALETKLVRAHLELTTSAATANATAGAANTAVAALRKESALAAAALQVDIQHLEDDLRQLRHEVRELEPQLAARLTSASQPEVDTAQLAAQVMQRLEEEHDLAHLTEQAVAAAWEAFNAAAEQDALKQNGLLTRFRCLSCDADLPLQRPVALNALQSRAGLVPKVDGVPAKEGHGPPTGPGLGAGELRRLQEMAADRAQSPMGGNSPAHSKSTTPHHSPPRQRPISTGPGLQTTSEMEQRPGTSVPRDRDRLVRLSGGDPLSLLQQATGMAKQRRSDDETSVSEGGHAGSRSRGIQLGDTVVHPDIWDQDAANSTMDAARPDYNADAQGANTPSPPASRGSRQATSPAAAALHMGSAGPPSANGKLSSSIGRARSGATASKAMALDKKAWFSPNTKGPPRTPVFAP